MLLLGGNSAFADGFWSQFKDPDDGRLDASSFLADNAYGFLPMPIIITDPAVDGGLGLAGLFFHETDEQEEKRLEALKNSDDAAKFLLTPSVSVVAGAMTGNDSWFAGGGHMGFFKQGRIRYVGGGGYGDVNLDFFGFGEIEMIQPIELNTKAFFVKQSLKFQVGDSQFFVGVAQQYANASIKPGRLGDLAGDILPPEWQDRWQELVRGLLTQDVVTSALGINFEFDSRDNFFSPRAGYRYKLEHLWFRDSFGSDIDYDLYSLGGLNYFRLSKSLRGGLRLNAEIVDSDEILPPFAQPAMSLRGVPAARYQGTYVGVIEGEITWELDARWSLLGFAGVGRAANSGSEFSSASSRVSEGLGFRYEIARRYGLHMGVDVARGPEDTVLYIQAGSAW